MLSKKLENTVTIGIATAIEMIEGRSDDVLSLLNSNGEKVLVFPDFIRRAIVFSESSFSRANYYRIG